VFLGQLAKVVKERDIFADQYVLTQHTEHTPQIYILKEGKLKVILEYGHDGVAKKH
jgi:hypothetical protein